MSPELDVPSLSNGAFTAHPLWQTLQRSGVYIGTTYWDQVGRQQEYRDTTNLVENLEKYTLNNGDSREPPAGATLRPARHGGNR